MIFQTIGVICFVIFLVLFILLYRYCGRLEEVVDISNVTIQKLEDELQKDQSALTYYQNHKETEAFVKETYKEESKV